MTTLTLIRGLPGSGKSTLADKLKFEANVLDQLSVKFEADQFFETYEAPYYKFDQSKIGQAHEQCQNSCAAALVAGRNVFVSNTFTTIRELRPYFDLALDMGILPTVILCQNQYGSIHGVPDETMDRMRARFQYDISGLISQYANLLKETASE